METYRRGDQYLVILSQIPQWFVVDRFGFKVFQQMHNGKSIMEISAQYPMGQHEEIKGIHDALYPLLHQEVNRDAGVVENALTSKTTVAMISITRNCNLQSICPHCYVDASGDREHELSITEHTKLAQEITVCLTPDPSKTYKVNLTGGEPFFRKDIIQIINSYRMSGLEVNMSTNAMLIKPAHIPALIEMGVILSVSLDGSTQKTHDQIRGKGAWKKVTNKIYQLTTAGVKVGINCLLHDGNTSELEAMIRQAHMLGCSGFNPINLVQLGRACKSSLHRVSEVDIFKRLANYLVKHPEYAHLFELSSLFSSLGAAVLAGITCENCGIGNRPCIYVDETGNVYPCPNTQMKEFLLGNIRKSSLSSCVKIDHPVLQMFRSLQVSSLNPKCGSCDVRFFCGGDCRGETYSVTGDLAAPYVACKDRHDSIIELMWIASEHPKLFENRAAEYISNLH